MGISKNDILNNLQNELTFAQMAVDNEEKMKQHISRMTMLCDLLLASPANTTTINEITISDLETNEQEDLARTQGKQIETEDPYDIFDF